MNLHRLLADLLLVAHFAYAGLVVVGLPVILLGAVRRWRWVRSLSLRVIHLLMIGVVVAESVCGLPCPLTRWENALRTEAGQHGYSGAFLAGWLRRLLYYDLPEWVFTTCYCLFGAAVLLALILVPPRWPGAGQNRGAGR